ncbi:MULTISPECIES: hypothetical protein [Rahnella]|uniref:O-antigen ligase domain-containing protein n=1 Tax=Rahnella laticis TaxID=2787622 RepID=A0ABS0E7J0_9GAMM|nr:MULTISPECIES: hypothetical protein [Rahnella]MBF7979229.1 hypothetical protein [Rahnella laticis]
MIRLKNFLLFMTFALPKAGAKIGGFPLYVSLISSFYFMVSGLIFVLKRKTDLLFVLLAFSLICIMFLFNQLSFAGADYYRNGYLGFASVIAYITSFFSFLCYYGALKIKNSEEWKKHIAVIFYLLVIYALMQKIFGDYNVTIPGITANYQDAMTHDFLAGKNNMIWGIGYLKATSTYQNGNLFGANLLLIGYSVIANNRSANKKIMLPMIFLCIVVLLTASVSIYLGLIVGCLWMFFTSKNNSGSTVVMFWFGVLILALILTVMFSTDNIFLTIIQERLFNRDLSEGSGRIEKIKEYVTLVGNNPWVLVNGMLFYSKEFEEAYEVLPVAILQILGLPILIFYVFFVLSKLKLIVKSPYVLPFIAYFSASLSDGAYWLPPTATNLFIILGLCTSWHIQGSRKCNMDLAK